VDFAQSARLLLREEILFGRHGEQPGTLRQRLRVTLDGRALYDQELAAGPDAPGWTGPAVTAGHRSAGNLLVVDPELPDDGPDAPGAVMALPGPAALATILAPDTAALRRRLNAALTHLLSSRP
jgi:urease accessory protein